MKLSRNVRFMSLRNAVHRIDDLGTWFKSMFPVQANIAGPGDHTQ